MSNAISRTAMESFYLGCDASWPHGTKRDGYPTPRILSKECLPLNDGDRFEAEIKGTTMWVHALKGGNLGKAVKIKYKILDVRKQTPPHTASNDQCRGNERDTSEE